jgi:hypothetical protein
MHMQQGRKYMHLTSLDNLNDTSCVYITIDDYTT